MSVGAVDAKINLAGNILASPVTEGKRSLIIVGYYLIVSTFRNSLVPNHLPNPGSNSPARFRGTTLLNIPEDAKGEQVMI